MSLITGAITLPAQAVSGEPLAGFVGIAINGSSQLVLVNSAGTAATFALTFGKTLTVSNTLTLTGTDGASANLDRLANLATGKVLGRTTAGTGAVEELSISGTGSVAMTNSPSFTTPTLGTPASGALSNCTSIPAGQLTGDVALARIATALTAPGAIGGGTASTVGATVLNIPATTSSVGQITQAGSKILHTYGTRNVWLGLDAGNFTTTGSDCVGIGNNAGLSLGAGASNNMLIGANSGAYMTTGYSNVCIGISTGYALAGGKENVAIGYVSMQNGASGGNNVAIGYAAFQNIGAGTYNVAIGSGAGNSTAAVGGISGVNITTGDYNTLIGNDAAVTLADAQYRTAIGAGSRCASDNTVTLGRAADAVVVPGSLAVTGAATLGAAWKSGAPQVVVGNGAVAAPSLTTLVSVYENNGTADTTATLAAGADGQIKVISCNGVVSTYNVIITATIAGGYTAFLLDDKQGNIVLQYSSTLSAWVVLAISAQCILA